MERLTLTPVVDLSAYHVGHELVAFDAGHDGRVYLAFAQQPLEYRKTIAGGASTARTQPSRPQSYRVISVQGSTVDHDVLIEGERFNIHFVQPFTDGLLLSCARSHYSSSGRHEHNGRLYSRDGVFTGEVLLGDGIQDVQTTAGGVIWVSYFDEGVFGNFGWSQPLGAAGLVAWDRDGKKLFEFEPTGDLDTICDCYALNVQGEDDAWICYYTEFPLVHLRGGRAHRVWQAPVEGSGAFAIDSGHCLFQGGYKAKESYVLAELGSQKSPANRQSLRAVRRQRRAAGGVAHHCAWRQDLPDGGDAAVLAGRDVGLRCTHWRQPMTMASTRHGDEDLPRQLSLRKCTLRGRSRSRGRHWQVQLQLLLEGA